MEGKMASMMENQKVASKVDQKVGPMASMMEVWMAGTKED
jgi:hypothetical protein